MDGWRARERSSGGFGISREDIIDDIKAGRYHSLKRPPSSVSTVEERKVSRLKGSLIRVVHDFPFLVASVFHFFCFTLDFVLAISISLSHTQTPTHTQYASIHTIYHIQWRLFFRTPMPRQFVANSPSPQGHLPTLPSLTMPSTLLFHSPAMLRSRSQSNWSPLQWWEWVRCPRPQTENKG